MDRPVGNTGSNAIPPLAVFVDSALAARLDEDDVAWGCEPAVFGIDEADLDRADERDRALWLVPDVTEPNSTEAGNSEPGNSEPGSSEPSNSKPGSSEPSNSKPNTARQSSEPSEADGDLRARLIATLTEAKFPDHVVSQLAAAAPALSSTAARSGVGVDPVALSKATDDQLVAATDALVIVQRWTDAGLLALIRDLAVSAGNELLHRKGVADPGELSKSARETWRARTKSVIANELQVLTGWGIQDCHDRVGFALAPRATTHSAEEALSAGHVDWRQVKTAWQACRHLPPEVAATVLERTLAPGSRARSKGDAEVGSARQSYRQVKEALDRELTRVTGIDPKKAREERRSAVARRDAYAELEDNGTGIFTATGSTSSVAAAITRVDRIARAARAAGDERTLSQLRSDVTLGLVLHGTLTPTLSRLAARNNDDPTVRPLPLGDVAETAGAPPPGGDEPESSALYTNEPQYAAIHTSEPQNAALGADVMGGPDATLARLLAAEPDIKLELVVPLDALVNPDSKCIGEIPGHSFITAEHARDLALQAGVLHRVVVDPLDGRLIERTAKGYRPDAAMRAQIRAADRHCRAPGCTVPAGKCQHDHEVAYQHDKPDGGDGPTAEWNLNLKHGGHHQVKTLGLWTTVMDALRNVTWTTFFGQCYGTRAYDYRVYTTDLEPQPGSDGTATAGDRANGPPGSTWDTIERLRRADADPALDHDLRDRLIYSALAHRGPDDRLAAPDDDADNDLAPRWARLLDSDVPIRLRHRISGGIRRRGAPPDQPTPEEILHEHERLFAEPRLSQDDADRPPEKNDSDPPPPF